MHAAGDPTGRPAGEHARSMVRRLRLRTLVSLGVLAIATGELGRTFGLHDGRFLASAELYDPRTRSWRVTGGARGARALRNR